jgi:hypothetical protein
MEINEDFNDAAIQNLIGDGADSIARVWADTGRSIDKLAVIEPFLRGKTRDVVRRTLGLPPVPDENFNGDERAVSALKRIRDAQHIQAYRSSGGESDQETGSDDDDAHMRTAKALFGITGMSQIVGPQGEERMQTSQSRHPLAEESVREDTVRGACVLLYIASLRMWLPARHWGGRFREFTFCLVAHPAATRGSGGPSQ